MTKIAFTSPPQRPYYALADLSVRNYILIKEIQAFQLDVQTNSTRRHVYTARSENKVRRNFYDIIEVARENLSLD